tara:strand:+ start:17149 stop:19089 length:1941 start_codon:yes stop_codon:yes gene_type:complete
MCGFIGSIGNNAHNETSLKKMTDSLIHRGPDTNSYWIDNSSNFSFGHTRLAIQDISENGYQPMHSFSGRYVITFNGEIYNHRELRTKLENELDNEKKINWKSTSDTETILTLIEIFGILKTVFMLKGMFSFAVWDKKEKELTLARDRIGEKPLYYGKQKNSFIFGSELKALKIHPDFLGKINQEAVVSFMRYSYIPSPMSIYHGIYKLPSGSIATIKESKIDYDIKIHKYWSLNKVIAENIDSKIRTDEEIVSECESKLVNSISGQQISDVPIGAFLSGGIDSSLIVSLMQKISHNNVKTFTIGSTDRNFDESNIAKKISNYLGTNHQELLVSPDDALKVIPSLSNIYDEPFADSSQIPTYLVSKLASENVKVCLSGDGGDELFSGYNRYIWSNRILQTPLYLKIFAEKILNLINTKSSANYYNLIKNYLPKSLKVRLADEKLEKISKLLSIHNEKDFYKSLISTSTDEEELLNRDICNQSLEPVDELWEDLNKLNLDFTTKMMVADVMMYLTDDILCKVDRASMHHSLEVRTPFLDYELVEYVFSINHKSKKNNKGKWITKEILKKYVPLDYLSNVKTGFSVPIDAWLRGPLKDWGESLIEKNMIEKHGFLNFENVKFIWEEHQNGFNKNKQLWNVLMLQSWLNN